jgi:hypothetical protein
MAGLNQQQQNRPYGVPSGGGALLPGQFNYLFCALFRDAMSAIHLKVHSATFVLMPRIRLNVTQRSLHTCFGDSPNRHVPYLFGPWARNSDLSLVLLSTR